VEEEREISKDWWDELSESKKAQINAGLEDVKNGRVMSSDEFWTRLKSTDV